MGEQFDTRTAALTGLATVAAGLALGPFSSVAAFGGTLLLRRNLVSLRPGPCLVALTRQVQCLSRRPG